MQRKLFFLYLVFVFIILSTTEAKGGRSGGRRGGGRGSSRRGSISSRGSGNSMDGTNGWVKNFFQGKPKWISYRPIYMRSTHSRGTPYETHKEEEEQLNEGY